MHQVNYPFEGVLLVDKPTGCTSHDVVGRLRRKLGMKKIGHAGTLDPNATGLLVALVGGATRLSQYLMGSDKVYEGVARLGEQTNTYDVEGELTASFDGELPDAEALRAVFKSFEGDQQQVPPMFSAKKIKGVPLYKHARKGRELEREARWVHVYGFEFLKLDEAFAHFKVKCSKGTYVRSLVHEAGQKLGCGAHLFALRRTQSGDLSLENAHTLDELEAMEPQRLRRCFIPIYQAAPSHLL